MPLTELKRNTYQAQVQTMGLLSENAPQTLLIEGGTEKARFELTLYWAMTANCPNASNGAPCLECPTCKQIESLEYLDLFIFDGRISNKDDEEKPGPVKALRIENLRTLKQALGTEPRGKKRVIIILGITQTREEAANSLLKTLEEPATNALFVLLAPQREQLLPTLVSRSFCLSLPWITSEEKNSAVAEWEHELGQFLGTGKGFMSKLGTKGATDAGKASEIILACQKALADALADRKTDSPLQGYFRHLAAYPELAFEAGQWLAEAQVMLLGTVNPARILEALCCRLYMLPKN